jgi:hypothetical protein
MYHTCDDDDDEPEVTGYRETHHVSRDSHIRSNFSEESEDENRRTENQLIQSETKVAD